MSALGNKTDSAARGVRRRLRAERERERKLVLRHRWYAGGVATLLSGALLFAGLTPAVADTTTPSPSPSETSADVSTDPGDTTTDPSTEPTDPAGSTEAPVEPSEQPSEPAETESPAPEETDPADDTDDTSTQSRLAPTEDASIGVQAVPPATGNNAVITVKVGSDRTGLTSVTNLAGVTLVLNTGENAPSGTRPDGQSGTTTGWALCVSDAQGDCSFTVPNTAAGGGQNGVNRDQRYWVVQAAVPAGYYGNPTLRVGESSGGGDPLAYTFRTGAQLRAGNTYTSLNNFMSTATGYRTSGGVWQQSRTNPGLTPSCGLDVALILDISGSVGSALPNLKQAANTFVDSLVGTPSRMSLFSFSWETPGAGASQNYPDLTSVSAQNQANDFKNRYSGWTSGGGTNWDRGLGIAAESNTGVNKFDVAVVITDGNPTTYNQPYQGNGQDNRFIETENGIFSANAIKAAGSRVIAFGVGAGATGATNALNLRAISGTTVFNGSNGQTADYYQTTDYAAVGTALRNLALGNCSGNLTVTKQIVPNTAPAGSTQGAVPAGAGWQFNGVSNTAGVTTPNASRTTINDGTGTVAYPLTFTGGVTSGSVTVTETQQTGYTLTQVSGANAVCKNLNTNQPVTVTNQGALGFSVNVPSTEAVNCVVYNRAPNPAADVTVTKKWNVNGVDYANGAQPGGLSAQLSLTGPGQAGATPQGWGVTRTGYTLGNTTALAETVTLIDAQLCTNVATVTEVNGVATNVALGNGYNFSLSKEHNTATITNKVTCQSKLTLKKNVDNANGGSAQKTDWTLKADGATPIQGVDGAATVTNATVTPGSYALSETGGPAGYNQTNLVCTGGTLSGSNVSVPLGGNVTCTFTNASAAPKLTLVKQVVNDNGGTTPKTAWTLSATTPNGPNVSGVTETPAVTAAPVRAGVVYTLGESSIAGYDWTNLSCNSGYTATTKNAPTLTLKPGDNVTCTFTNDDQPGKLTLIKVVDNTNGGTKVATDWNQKLTAKRGSDATLAFNHNETKNVPAGTYALAEVGQIAGYQLTGIVCSTGAEKVTSVTVPNGGNVSCTFTNVAQKPTLTLEKQVVNTGGGTSTADEWTLTAANGGVNAINGKGIIVSPNVAAISGAVEGNKQYTLSETGPSGYTASDWTCAVTGTGTSVPVTDGNKVTPQVGQNVTCRIVNTAVPGSGTVTKTVTSTQQNQDGTWTVTYKIEVTNTSAASTYTYDLKDVLNFGGGITPGKPAVSGPQGVPINNSFTGIAPNTTIAGAVALTKAVGTHTYTVVVTSTVADAVADNGNDQCKPPAAGGFLNTASIYKAGTDTKDGESAACSQPVFPNIAKDGKAATQNPDASFNVEYSVTVSNPSSTTAVQATLSDVFPAAPAGWTLQTGVWVVAPTGNAPAPVNTTFVPGNGAIWSGVLPANTSYTYTIKGTLVPGAGATPIGQCEAGGGLINKADVTSGLVVKNDEGCVSIVVPPVTVVKSNAGAVKQLSLTQWEILYTVTVANASQTTATTYTLTDTPQPGAGWTVDPSSNWVDPAPVANTVIEAGGSDSFEYRMVVNRNAQVTNPSTTCDLTDGGAFFNKATVTFPGGTASDTGCGAPGTPTVVKTGKPATSNGDGTYTISYEVAVSNTSGKTLVYSLTDTPPANPAGTTITGWKVTGPGASATWPTPNVIAEKSIASGTTDTFTITATVAIGAGFTPVPNACGEGTSTGVAIINTATVTNGIKAVNDDGCTSVNSLPVTVEKKVDSVQQAVDGTWTVNYTVAVKGPASGTTPYSLTDTPAFAAADGVTITGLSWTGQTAGGPTTTFPATLQQSGVISAGQTHTWQLTATATIAVPAGKTLGACETAKGPFFNSATVTFPGGSNTATACDEPGKPTVEKTPLAPVFDPGTGQWTLSFTLAVTNKQGMNLAYTLSDVPAALPAGVTGVTAWTATGPDIQNGTGQDAGTLAAWNGENGTVATGLITDAATHVYTITRVVTIGAGVTGEALDCRTGGFKNVGTVTNGVGGNSDDACISIERPGVDVAKTVTSTTQNVDGTWTIVYGVTVTNQSATLPAVYDLTDQLVFGAGIQVDGATWSKEPDGPETPFTAPLDGVQALATGAGLAAGATDAYTVTVQATISQDAWVGSGSQLVCKGEGTYEAGGFLNTATVVAGGKTDRDDACSTPDLPEFEKVGVSAIQNPDDASKWAVTYELRVTAGEYDTYYSLSDTPLFAPGITVLSGEAQLQPDGAPIAVTSGVPFVTDVPIAKGTTQTYRMTWNVDLTGDFDPATGACDGEDTGFFNLAVLSVGDVEIPGVDCIPVEDRVYPVPTKTVTSTTQDPETGDWTIVYDVEVALAAGGTPENPSGLSAEYDLTDTLDFGGDIEIGSAEWSGESSGTFPSPDATVTLADDKTIKAGQTHTYTVTVVASVTADAIENGTITCEEDDNGPFGGFLNTALMTSGGQTVGVDACAEPAFPEIAKTGGEPVQNADGSWTIEYFIDVTYPESDAEPLPEQIGYVLTDAPVLPENVTLDGNWTAEAADDATPDPTGPSWNGEGEWTIVSDGVLTPEDDTHRYRIFATVDVTAPEDFAPQYCEDTDSSGILIPNTAVITSGEYVADDEGCQVVQYDDVSIVKTSQLPEGQEWVEPGDTFDYVLTVTNNGTRPATNVEVTDDDLNERLNILGLDIDGAVMTNPPGYTGRVVDVKIASLPVGGVATITVTVEFTTAAVTDPEIVAPGDEPPTAPTPVEQLENTACVTADIDGDDSNNCDDHEIPVRDLTGVLYIACVSDAAKLGWSIAKSGSLVDLPTEMLWVPNNGVGETVPPNVQMTQPAGSTTWSDVIDWPGSAYTPSGVAIDYPGWRAIQLSDIVPGSNPTQYYVPGTTDIMTPEQQATNVYNGLILDDSELDYSWREGSTVTFSVNPELVFETSYPSATPEGCSVARHTDVQIEKTASVEKTEPGKSFTYDLAVANVSDDSAAEGVVVTDVIPADLRITDVSWPGKGDANAFPNWTTCEVTGQTPAGYGGTLECVLFGPLQPVGTPAGGTSAAPTITLSAYVNPSAKSNVINNIGVVDYHTFGDPEDSGRDQDDATVLLSGLPATGGESVLPIAIIAIVALVGGLGALLVVRRRRGEKRPVL